MSQAARVTILLTSIVLLGFALPVLAQDEPPPLTEEVSSDDGTIVVRYPDGWLMYPLEDESGETLFTLGLANRDSALGEDSLPQPGDARLALFVQPPAAPPGQTFDLQADLQSVEALYTQRGAETSGVSRETFGGRPGARVAIRIPDVVNLLIVSVNLSGVIGYVSLLCADGELERWEPTVRAIAESITYTPAESQATTEAEATSQAAPTETVELTPESVPDDAAVPQALLDAPIYASPDGRASFRYPPGWLSQAERIDNAANYGLYIVLASDEAAAGKSNAVPSADLEAGEVVVLMAVGELAALFGAETETVPAALLDEFVYAEQSGYSSAAEFTLGTRAAARVERRGERNDELAVLVADPAGTAEALVVIYTAPGELDRWEETLLAVAASVEYTGEVETRAQALLAGARLTETFTSDDESYTVRHPKGWRVEVSTSGALIVYSTGYTGERPLPAGITLMTFSLFPVDALTGNLGVEADAELVDIVTAAIDSSPEELRPLFGVPTPTQIGDREAAYVTNGAQGEDTVLYMLRYDNEYLLLVLLTTAAGEFDRWMPVALTMSQTIEYNP